MSSRLVLYCTFDSKTKKITFRSQKNCNYESLRARVEESFSLRASSYIISYTDDDREITNISSDRDLHEAIEYFQAGEDNQSVSSGTSMLSVRSGRKITLRFDITVEGPSLSDGGSILTLDEDEYRDRNGSHSSFSFGAPSMDLDDDAAT
ncbi:hypothetical protein MPER_10414, partial [Moniliophthora perniciosa FA553]